jgi:hypothetical protein
VLTVPLVSAPTPGAAAQSPQGKKPTVPPPLVKLLDDEINWKYFQQPMSLTDALGLLFELLGQEGKDFPITVDTDAFREADFHGPDVYETQVRLPQPAGKTTVGHVLRSTVQQIPTKATFVVYPDRIEITTLQRTTPEYKLKQPITATFDKCKVAEALAELSAKTATTIVLDPRVGNKANTLVSATFLNDVKLAGALRTLAEMADLKVVVFQGVLLVTTAAHAEGLRGQQAAADDLPHVPGLGAPLGPLVEFRQRRLEAMERADLVWPFVFVPCKLRSRRAN